MEQNKITAVIFDWAGTTIDYGSFAPVQAFIAAFQEYGITPTIEEVRKPMGMLKKNHIRTMLEMPRIKGEWRKINGSNWTEKDVDKVYRSSEKSIMPILKDFSSPKPFVIETIKKLRDMEIAIGSTTGYTDEMMQIVAPKAKEQGYSPDFLCTPNAVNNQGRPYPFMLFKNLEVLSVKSIYHVIKVGDTVADIQEAKNAGVVSVGIIEGSSIMGLSEREFESMSLEDKEKEVLRVKKVYEDCGADYMIKDMSELVSLIEIIEKNKTIH